MNKKFLAEFIGTFGLALAVLLASELGAPLQTPVLAGLVVGIFVYTLGSISGTHLNPAVTIAQWSLKRISGNDAIGYAVAQFLGAGVAIFVGSALAASPVMVPLAVFDLKTFLGEVLGTAILAFGIASVVFGRTPSDASGLVIGGSLMVGVTMAALIAPGAGVLNPAVAFALRTLDFTHLLGPIAGSLIGFRAYRSLI